jgi:putative hemolysin
MSQVWWFWMALASVAIGGVFSSLFYALSDLSRPALEEIVSRKNNPQAQKRLERILDDLTGHAHAIALLRIVCNALAAVATTLWIAVMRSPITPEVALPGVDKIDVLIGVPVAALIVWVFGLVIPASVARHAGEQAVYGLAPLIRVVHVFTSPIQAVVRFLDEVVRRLAGQHVQTEAEEFKEEVLSVVEDARHGGQFDDSDRDMIEAVVRFRDTTVAQIMTPRTEIEAMELTNDLGKVTARIRGGGHSRIPVYEGTIDRIVGVFYVKDLMRWLAGEGSRGGRIFNLRTIVRPAIFVPETKTVRELLTELLGKRVHIAIVADEFGGTAGLATIEDIVELVFGDIQDEYEVPEEGLDEVRMNAGTGTAEVDARSYITDVNAQIREIGLELPEGEDYDTVGGLVTVTLGRIPVKGESVMQGGMKITVLDAEATRVTRVRLERPGEPPAPRPGVPDRVGARE